MRKLIFLTLFLAVIFSMDQAFGDEPTLKSGRLLTLTGGALSVDRHSAPEIVDWNNDGKKDILIGQFAYGYIWLFINTGTELNPAFTSGVKLMVGASPITTSYG